MSALKDIVHLINQGLIERLSEAECAPQVAGTKFYLIAQTAYKRNPDGTERPLPAVFAKDGKIQYVGVEDMDPAIIYHRHLGTQFVPGSNRSGFGDGRGVTQIDAMRLVAYWDRSRIAMENDEFGRMIAMLMPRNIKNVPKFGNVAIAAGMIIQPNNLAAFRQEYEAFPYFLNPEHSLITVSYNLESTLDPNCFNVCP